VLRLVFVAGLALFVGAGAAETAVAEVRLIRADGNDEVSFAFDPALLTVPAGTTVRWINERDVFHTVTFTDSLDRRVPNGTFDQSLSTAGQVIERAFDSPGRFFYFCQPHSTFMAASLVVTQPPGGDNEWRWWAAGAVGVVLVAVVTYVLMRRGERRTVRGSP